MEDIFWSDQIANLIINRNRYNYLNKDYKIPKTITIKSSTSISGLPHIGNASDIIRHDAIVRSLREKKQKVNFIWVAEDMDPWRKVPANLPKEYSKYLGMPVSSLPSPDGSNKSYVDYFVDLFMESLKKEYGTSPKVTSTTKEYKEGTFYKYIKKCLENLDEIKEILEKYRKDKLSEDYSLWKPVCEKCGKIITTVVTDINGEGVYYECKDYDFKEYGKEAYNKIRGCGYKGFSNIKKDSGKLLWVAEWASEWAAWNVVFEGAGKEHFMPTGSFWRAGEICERILGWPEPYPGNNQIQPYEYITVDNEKMSASKGNVVATWEWSKFALPETLRLLFLKRPRKTRDFKYQEIFHLVDEFDELEKIYFDITKLSNKKDEIDSKRLFEMSCISKPKKYTYPTSFTLLANLSQIYKSFDQISKVLKSIGHEVKNMSINKKRFEMAKFWVEKYGPDFMRFKVNEKPDKSKLNKKQVESLKLLKEKLKLKDYNPDELLKELYNIPKQISLSNNEFFKGVYLALISKERGPKLSNLILAIGKNKIISILEKI